MIRVNVLAEGQSEMKFAKDTLNNFFMGNPIIDARCVLTGRDSRTNYEHRGGLVSYAKAKNDIMRWLNEDKTAYVTTMFDFFRLPTDFPNYEYAMTCDNHRDFVERLERAMLADIPSELSRRFIPYIQLHEFESLLFTDIRVLKADYLDERDAAAIDALYEDTKSMMPEDINHGATTAPSKRLMNAIDYRKGDFPVSWLNIITVPKIKERCPHFAAWIDKLSNLQEISQ